MLNNSVVHASASVTVCLSVCLCNCSTSICLFQMCIFKDYQSVVLYTRPLNLLNGMAWLYVYLVVCFFSLVWQWLTDFSVGHGLFIISVGRRAGWLLVASEVFLTHLTFCENFRNACLKCGCGVGESCSNR